MKKLVFKLGAASLAVLPVVAIASCSTTTTTPNQTINTEVSKFEKLFQASEASKTMTTVEAKESINQAPTQDEKWSALNKLTQLPEKDSNFTYTVMNATIDKNVDSWLIVTMEIAEKTARNNNEVLKFVIADLKPVDTALDKEAAKFNISSPVNKDSEKMKTNLIITNINNAKDNKTKLEILNKLTTFPQISPEFTMEVLFAKPSAEPTSVAVMISITEKASGNSKNATFTITGLVALTGQEKLEQQASLLLSRETLLPNGTITAFEAKKAITNTTIFNTYYAPVLMAPGVTYEFTGASVNAKVNTTLDVTLTVSGEVKTTPILKTIQLTGFTSPKSKLEEQAKFLVNKPAVFPNGPTTALKAKAAITNRETLDLYYKPIGMAPGISYAFKESAVNTDNTILDVTLEVSDEFGTQPVTRVVELSGFVTPQQELIAASELLKNAETEKGKGTETAQEAKEAITSTDSLIPYYSKKEIGSEFSYTWKSTTVVGDTVSVVVSVASSVEGTTPVDKTIIISGFKTVLTVESERFAISKAATTSTTKVTTAIRNINEAVDNAAKLAAINNLVTGFPVVSTGFELVIGQASRVTGVDTSVNISLTIKQTSSETEQVVTFTITTLTAETNQQELERIANAVLTTKEVLSPKAGETAVMAAKAITTTSILGSYYAPVTLLEGMAYSLKEGQGSVIAEGETVKVKVMVTSDAANTIPYEKEIIITGFTTPLNFEANRFSISLAALNSELKTSTTIRNLNDATTSDAKLALINELVANFPQSTDGFTLTVGAASQSAETPTSINISLTITQSSGARTGAVTTKVVTFTITGLTSETAQEELVRLANEKLIDGEVLAQKATQTSTQAAKAITNDETLDLYYARVTLGTGITYTFASKAVSGDTLNVIVTVSSEGLESIQKQFNIFGFRTLLEAEAIKFTTEIAATNSATKTTTVLRAINGAKNNDEKIAAIKTFVNGFPSVSPDFKLTVGLATRDTITESSIHIDLTITQISSEKTAKATFTITTLTAQTNQEELVEQAKLLIGGNVTGEKAKQTAEQAAKLIRNDDILAEYYTKPTLLEGITYKFVSNSVKGNSVVINVMVSSTAAGTSPVAQSFELTGFATPLQAELAKFTVEAPAKADNIKMQAALRSINSDSDLQAKVGAINAITNNFPELSNLFTYVIGTAIAVEGTPTSMSIPITITNNSNRTESIATFTITGLVAETAQGELEGIASQYLGNGVATFPEGAQKELAIIVSPKITDKVSLEKYYKKVSLPTGFEYAYQSNVVEGDTIRVSVKLTNTVDSTSIDHAFLITGFKTPTSAVEEAAILLAVSKAKTADDITTTRQATRKINEASTQADKLAALKLIVSDFPTTTGVILTINSVEAKNNLVNISITISPETVSTRTGNLTVTFTITGLTAETPEEELKRLAQQHLMNKDVVAGKQSETALEASEIIVGDTTLNDYYTKVTTLGQGITYAWKSDRAVGNDVEVTVDVTDSVARVTIEHKFLIQKFTTPLQSLARKLNGTNLTLQDTYKLATTRQIARYLNDPTIGPELQLANLAEMFTNFPEILPTEFTLVIGKVTIDTNNTTVKIPVNISYATSSKVVEQPVDIVIIVNDLKEETVKQELERLAKGNLINKDMSSTSPATETAAAVAAKITDNTTLNDYYESFSIDEDIEYTFQSTSTIGNSVKINVVVTNTVANESVPYSFLLTNFKTPETLLEKEAAKFAVSLAAKVTDPVLTTIQAIRSFMEITGAGSEARLNALKALVAPNAFPANEATFSLSITGARVNPTTSTSIDVFLTVHEASAPSGKTGQVAPITSMNVIFTITGFTAETPQEELQRIVDGLVPVDAQTTAGLATTAADAKVAITNFDTLVAYYGPIKLGTGISLTVGEKVIPADTPNTLNISVTINGGENTTPVPHTIKIKFPPVVTPEPGPSTEGTKK